ncbi:MAG: LEA type 2 family protein [Steroidobacteraceae bacterium]
MLITGAPGRWLVCVFTAWVAAACSLVAPKFERPEVSVASIELVSGNLFQQNFLVKFNIRNPNDRALPVTSLHAELNVAGERLASGVSNRLFVVPAQGATQFDMTITANMASVLLKLGQRADNHSDSIDYDMTGSASVDLPFLHDLAFHQKGAFSLRAPQ